MLPNERRGGSDRKRRLRCGVCDGRWGRLRDEPKGSDNRRRVRTESRSLPGFYPGVNLPCESPIRGASIKGIRLR